MNPRKILAISTCLALATAMAMAVPAFAQTNGSGPSGNRQGQAGMPWGGSGGANRPGMQGGMMPGNGMTPGVFGTVTAVSGDSITMNGRQGFGSTSATASYSIDATNATVRKDNATSTIASIAVGDTIAVQGTVTGTNVVATNIIDGIMMRGSGQGQPGEKNARPGTASSTPVIGNGQPVIAGTVSVISGTSLTVTTASNVTYAVDATNAKITEGQNTSATLSSVAVGDKVLIQGTVNGTSVTASTVIDQSSANNGSGNSTTDKGQSRGFFAGIGSFFMHLFGF